MTAADQERADQIGANQIAAGPAPGGSPLAPVNAGAALVNAGAALVNDGAALVNTGAAWLEIGLVRVYQWTVRPFIGSHCRFWPSCSEYAVEALRVHGAARGTVMAAKRILRCNPWHEGGVDPVPRCEGHGIDRNMGH